MFATIEMRVNYKNLHQNFVTTAQGAIFARLCIKGLTNMSPLPMQASASWKIVTGGTIGARFCATRDCGINGPCGDQSKY
ncbi:hypothetical protein [Paracoccus broussonetiae]|nr:hypothetical protein [Paracoccus sp. CPCC 101403]